MDIQSLMVPLSGIAWTVTYVALVYRGLKDRSYGMPLVAMALNFAWELTFSLIYPPQGTTISLVINTIWLICDIAIVVIYFLFAYKYFKSSYGLSRPAWLFFSLFAFAASFAVMILGGRFFSQFTEYFLNDSFEGAKFIAFIQNALMSVAFVWMLYLRKSSEGQSLWIAIAKWIGTSMTVGISYILVHPGDWYFIGVFIFTSFVFDLIYIVQIYRQLRREGINPWMRF